MKSLSTLTFFTLLSTVMLAQPVLQNGNNHIHNGAYFAVSTASTSNGPGAAGANVNWDFSNLSPTPFGTATYIDPKTTPMSASFPSANYGYTIKGLYSYFNISATKMEVLAYTIASAGSGNDYSPNPRTMVTFPMTYGTTATDTWQKVGGSQNTVTITYDGYGTLKTPNKTYTNVIRIKETYGNGSDYQWYTVDPFMNIMIFDHNTNVVYFMDAATNGVDENNAVQDKIVVYPNPSKGAIHFKSNSNEINPHSTLIINDSQGKIIYNGDLLEENSFEKLNAGIYYYRIQLDGLVTQSGQFQVLN